MSTTDPVGGSAPVAELGYVEASDELDAIIAELDRGVVDVDRLEIRLRRAVEIVEELDRRIRGAREKVTLLVAPPGGRGPGAAQRGRQIAPMRAAGSPLRSRGRQEAPSGREA